MFLALFLNISQWEHQNSFNRDPKGYNNISTTNVYFGWSGTLLLALLVNLCNIINRQLIL